LETALQRVVHGEIYLSREISARLVKKFPGPGLAARKSPLEELTSPPAQDSPAHRRGPEIAVLLKVSPKTVEYHRLKLMERLNLRDIPRLVRFALQAGLIPQEG